MNFRTSFIFLLQVLLHCSSVLFQIASGQQSSKQIVAASISAIRVIKKNFETDLSGERTSRNQLFYAYDAFDNDFFKSLQNAVFIIEESKANSILNVLRATPDLICATRLKIKINDIKNKEAKKVYQFCAAEINAEIKKIKEDLSSGQKMINTAFNQAQTAIQACERVYTRSQNLNQLQGCVKQAESIVQNVVNRFEIVFEKRRSEKIVTILAKCTDETIRTVNNALNANYDDLARCLAPSSNDASRQLASVISTKYKLTLTSTESRNVATAIANLKADAPAVFAKLDAVQDSVVTAVFNRNRNRVVLKELISSNEDVIKYLNAFYKASVTVFGNPAKRCVRDGQNKVQNIVNSKTDELKTCLNSIKVTTSEGEINGIERSIINRENKEGFVAIVKCLADGVLYTDNTIACSQQADTNFVNFLEETSMKLNVEKQSVDLIETLVNRCENSVISTIRSSLVANEVTFENCLTKASINYNLF